MNNTKAVRFSETQAFAAWGYAVLGLAASASLAGLFLAPRIPSGRALIILVDSLLLGLIFNLLCLRTEVTDSELTVTFGALFPLYCRSTALSDIISAEAVTYAPLAEYGGWGIRGWGRNVALNARGAQGVRLTLRDGRRVLIGSQRADELAAALTAPR